MDAPTLREATNAGWDVLFGNFGMTRAYEVSLMSRPGPGI